MDPQYPRRKYLQYQPPEPQLDPFALDSSDLEEAVRRNDRYSRGLFDAVDMAAAEASGDVLGWKQKRTLDSFFSVRMKKNLKYVEPMHDHLRGLFFGPETDDKLAYSYMLKALGAKDAISPIPKPPPPGFWERQGMSLDSLLFGSPDPERGDQTSLEQKAAMDLISAMAKPPGQGRNLAPEDVKGMAPERNWFDNSVYRLFRLTRLGRAQALNMMHFHAWADKLVQDVQTVQATMSPDMVRQARISAMSGNWEQMRSWDWWAEVGLPTLATSAPLSAGIAIGAASGGALPAAAAITAGSAAESAGDTGETLLRARQMATQRKAVEDIFSRLSPEEADRAFAGALAPAVAARDNMIQSGFSREAAAAAANEQFWREFAVTAAVELASFGIASKAVVLAKPLVAKGGLSLSRRTYMNAAKLMGVTVADMAVQSEQELYQDAASDAALRRLMVGTSMAMDIMPGKVLRAFTSGTAEDRDTVFATLAVSFTQGFIPFLAELRRIRPSAITESAMAELYQSMKASSELRPELKDVVDKLGKAKTYDEFSEALREATHDQILSTFEHLSAMDAKDRQLFSVVSDAVKLRSQDARAQFQAALAEEVEKAEDEFESQGAAGLLEGQLAEVQGVVPERVAEERAKKKKPTVASTQDEIPQGEKVLPEDLQELARRLDIPPANQPALERLSPEEVRTLQTDDTAAQEFSLKYGQPGWRLAAQAPQQAPAPARAVPTKEAIRNLNEEEALALIQILEPFEGAAQVKIGEGGALRVVTKAGDNIDVVMGEVSPGFAMEATKDGKRITVSPGWLVRPKFHHEVVHILRSLGKISNSRFKELLGIANSQFSAQFKSRLIREYERLAKRKLTEEEIDHELVGNLIERWSERGAPNSKAQGIVAMVREFIRSLAERLGLAAKAPDNVKRILMEAMGAGQEDVYAQYGASVGTEPISPEQRLETSLVRRNIETMPSAFEATEQEALAVASVMAGSVDASSTLSAAEAVRPPSASEDEAAFSIPEPEQQEGDFVEVSMLGVAHPLTTYLGNKASLVARGAFSFIFPAGTSYTRIIEPMGGSGLLGSAFIMGLGHTGARWLNDLDPRVTNFYTQARDNQEELQKAIDALCDEIDNLEPIVMARPSFEERSEAVNLWWNAKKKSISEALTAEGAAWFLAQHSKTAIQGKGQKLLSEGQWQFKPSIRKFFKSSTRAYGKALQGVQITTMKAEDMGAMFRPGDLVVFDAPYVASEEGGKVADYDYGKEHVNIEYAVDFIHTIVKAAVASGADVVYTNNWRKPIVEALQQEGLQVIRRLRRSRGGDRPEAIGYHVKSRKDAAVGGVRPEGGMERPGQEGRGSGLVPGLPEGARPGQVAGGAEAAPGLAGQERARGAVAVGESFGALKDFRPDMSEEQLLQLAAENEADIARLTEARAALEAEGKIEEASRLSLHIRMAEMGMQSTRFSAVMKPIVADYERLLLKHSAEEGLADAAEARGNKLVYRMVRDFDEAKAILKAVKSGKYSAGFKAAQVVDGHATTTKRAKYASALKRGAIPVFTSPYPTVSKLYDEGAGLLVAIEYSPDGEIYVSSRAGSTQGGSYSATFSDSEHIIDARKVVSVKLVTPEQEALILDFNKFFESQVRRGAYQNAFKDKDSALVSANIDAARNLRPVQTTLGRPFTETPVALPNGLRVMKGQKARLANGATATLSGYRTGTIAGGGSVTYLSVTGYKGELPEPSEAAMAMLRKQAKEVPKDRLDSYYEGSAEKALEASVAVYKRGYLLNVPAQDIVAVWDKQGRQWVEAAGAVQSGGAFGALAEMPNEGRVLEAVTVGLAAIMVERGNSAVSRQTAANHLKEFGLEDKADEVLSNAAGMAALVKGAGARWKSDAYMKKLLKTAFAVQRYEAAIDRAMLEGYRAGVKAERGRGQVGAMRLKAAAAGMGLNPLDLMSLGGSWDNWVERFKAQDWPTMLAALKKEVAEALPGKPDIFVYNSVRLTLANLLDSAAFRLLPSRSREEIRLQVREFRTSSTSDIDGKSAAIAGRIKSEMVQESKAKMVDRIRGMLNQANKPPEPRKARAQKELLSEESKGWLRLVRSAVSATPNAVSKRMGVLLRNVQAMSVSPLTDEEDIKAARLTLAKWFPAFASVSNLKEMDVEDQTRMALLLYGQFGALMDKTEGQIKDAMDDIESALAGGKDAVMEARQTADAASSRDVGIMLNALRPDPALRRRKGTRGPSTRPSVIQTVSESAETIHTMWSRLLSLRQFASMPARLKYDTLSERLALGNQRCLEVKRTRIREWMQRRDKALESIFGMDAAVAWAELRKPRKEFVKFSRNELSAQELSFDNLLNILGWAEQPDYALLAEEKTRGRKYQKDIVDELSSTEMGKAALAWLDWLRDSYTETVQDVSDVSEKLTGLKVVHPCERYMPGFHEKDFNREVTVIDANIFPASLTLRREHHRDVDEKMGATDIWEYRLVDDSHFVAYAEYSTAIRGVFGNREVSRAIAKAHGDAVAEQFLEQWTDMVRGGYPAYQDKIVSFLATLTAVTQLSWRLATTARIAATAPAQFGYKTGLSRLLSYSCSFMSDEGVAAMRKIASSKQWENRFYFGNSLAAEVALSTNAVQRMDLMLQKGIHFIQYGERVPDLVIGQGLYRDRVQAAIARGERDPAKIEQEALDYVFQVIDETQQGLDPSLRSQQMRRAGSYFKFMLMFSQNPAELSAMELASYRNFRAGQPGAGRQMMNAIVMGHILMPLSLELVKMLFYGVPDDDRKRKKEFRWFLLYMLSGPWANVTMMANVTMDGVSSMLGGFRGKEQWWTRAGIEAGQLVEHTMSFDWDQALSDMDQLAKTVGVYRDVRTLIDTYLLEEKKK